MSRETLLLIFSVVIFLIGLAIYGYITTRRSEYFNTANTIAWFLISFLPVVLVFLLVPDSSFSLDTGKIQAGGAMGAFLVCFWLGRKFGREANDLDAAKREIERLKAEKASLETARKPSALKQTEIHSYGVRGVKGKEVSVITGNLTGIKSVDVWVNSENTNMQMPSFFDRSISGTIRYYGGRRNTAGHVTDDIIAKALAREMGGHVVVAPGTVIVTESGELQRTHNVEKVFHVAAVQGQAGVGYRQIEDVHCCVVNALERMDELNREGASLRSIVFPFLGTGQARGDPKATAAALAGAAAAYFRDHRETEVEEVFFLAFTDADLEVWTEALRASPDLAPTKGARRRSTARTG